MPELRDHALKALADLKAAAETMPERPRVVRPTSAPPGRRIVQIAVAYNSDREVREDSLYALCNDGSVWIMCWGHTLGPEHDEEAYWMRLADIPTD